MVQEDNFIMLIKHQENFIIFHSAVLRLALEKNVLPYYILDFKNFQDRAQKNKILHNDSSLTLSQTIVMIHPYYRNHESVEYANYLCKGQLKLTQTGTSNLYEIDNFIIKQPRSKNDIHHKQSLLNSIKESQMLRLMQFFHTD